MKWTDGDIKDAITQLNAAATGPAGAKPAAINADGSVIVGEIPTGGGGGGSQVAQFTETPVPPTGQALITAPADGTAFSLVGAIPLTVAWTAVPGAAAYRLTFTGPIAATLDVPGATTFTATLQPGLAPPGAYQVRVTPLSATGQPGPTSDPVGFSLIPAVAVQAADRPFLTAPQDGDRFTRGNPVTFAWTAIAGLTQYGFEFTGANLVFANPNGTTPDAVNGFGGAGGGFLIVGTSFTPVLPTSLAPGTYQVRIVGLTAAGALVGSFGDAVTIVVE